MVTVEKKGPRNLPRWHTSVIPAFGKLSHENHAQCGQHTIAHGNFIQLTCQLKSEDDLPNIKRTPFVGE